MNIDAFIVFIECGAIRQCVHVMVNLELVGFVIKDLKIHREGFRKNASSVNIMHRNLLFSGYLKLWGRNTFFIV